MSTVVVTNKFFIKAKHIINVAISESIVYDDNSRQTKCSYYQIQMYFCYDDGSGNTRDTRHISIEIVDKAEAYKEFMEIVKQIRDQNPDDAHMNKLFESALVSSEDAIKEIKHKKKKKKKTK